MGGHAKNTKATKTASSEPATTAPGAKRIATLEKQLAALKTENKKLSTKLQPEHQSGLTLEAAAKRVSRTVAVIKDGKPTGKTKQVAIEPDEILSYRDYGDRVVVVTTAGEKLTANI